MLSHSRRLLSFIITCRPKFGSLFTCILSGLVVIIISHRRRRHYLLSLTAVQLDTTDSVFSRSTFYISGGTFVILTCL
jgi:hypothetical protein